MEHVTIQIEVVLGTERRHRVKDRVESGTSYKHQTHSAKLSWREPAEDFPEDIVRKPLDNIGGGHDGKSVVSVGFGL